MPKTVVLNMPGRPVHPATVTYAEYTPLASVDAPGIVGFCSVELKLFGPFQLKVAPPGLPAVKLSVDPAQSVEVPPAMGAAGVAFTMVFTVPAGLLQPREITVNEYIPAAAVVVAATVGFCAVDVKPCGPDHA